MATAQMRSTASKAEAGRGRADTDYAWAIAPPVNAAFIGAGLPDREHL